MGLTAVSRSNAKGGRKRFGLELRPQRERGLSQDKEPSESCVLSFTQDFNYNYKIIRFPVGVHSGEPLYSQKWSREGFQGLCVYASGGEGGGGGKEGPKPN